MAMAVNKMSDAGSQTDIFGDSDGRLSGSKLEHTDIAASDLFNSPIIQNVGLIDLVEYPRRLEVPSQPEAKTVVSCSCSNSVRSRCTPAQGVPFPKCSWRYETALAVGQIGIGGPRLGYQNFEEVTSGHPTWFNLEL